MNISPKLIALISLVLTLGWATSAFAQDSASKLVADFEVDPLAYGLQGHSLHVGLGWERYRVDLGSFALELPSSLHGQDGFESGFTGYGAKFDVFFKKTQSGAFVGLDASLARAFVTHQQSQISRRLWQGNVGVRAGYRFDLPADFFVSPWVSLTYNPLAKDVKIDGDTYKTPDFGVFPTVHLGRRF